MRFDILELSRLYWLVNLLSFDYVIRQKPTFCRFRLLLVALGLVLVRLTVHSKCAKGRVEVHTREGLHSSGDTRSLMPKRFAVPDENVAFSSRASPLIS